MYQDPRYIRSHEVKVRFSDIEEQLIDTLINITGQQRAVLVREMALKYARTLLKNKVSNRLTEGQIQGL